MGGRKGKGVFEQVCSGTLSLFPSKTVYFKGKGVFFTARASRGGKGVFFF